MDHLMIILIYNVEHNYWDFLYFSGGGGGG